MMRLAYITDNALGGNPPLHTLILGAPAVGHSIEMFAKDTEYDCVFICSSPHPSNNWHGQLEHLGSNRLAFFDWNEYGWQHSSCHSRFEFYFGFTDAVFAWNSEIATCYRPVRELLRGRSYLHFSRELFSEIMYPPGFHPIDPIDCTDLKVPLVSEDEFLARKQFLFVSQQNNHPHRAIIADMLKAWARTNGVPHYIVCGDPRLSLEDYHAGLSSSQVSVAYDGYAVSYSQPEILRRCALVRNKHSRLRPFQIGSGCVEYDCRITAHRKKQQANPKYSGSSTYWRTRSLKHLASLESAKVLTPESPPGPIEELHLEGTDLLEVLDRLWRNPRLAYQAYCEGHAFVHKYHTPESFAEYIVSKIAQHDWDTPTSWDILRLGKENKPPVEEPRPCDHHGEFTIYEKKTRRLRGNRIYQCSCGLRMTDRQLPANMISKLLHQPTTHYID